MITILKYTPKENIFGVFTSKKEANSFLANNRKKLKIIDSSIEIVETDLDFFPIYVLKRTPANIYNFTNSKHPILEWIGNIEPNKKDADYSYATVFRVSKPFSFEEIHADSMGLLEHIHITKSKIDMVKTGQLINFFGQYDEVIHHLEYIIKRDLQNSSQNDFSNLVLEQKIKEFQEVLSLLRSLDEAKLNIGRILNLVRLPYEGYEEYNYKLFKEKQIGKNKWITDFTLKNGESLVIKPYDFIISIKE